MGRHTCALRDQVILNPGKPSPGFPIYFTARLRIVLLCFYQNFGGWNKLSNSKGNQPVRDWNALFLCAFIPLAFLVKTMLRDKTPWQQLWGEKAVLLVTDYVKRLEFLKTLLKRKKLSKNFRKVE